MSPNRFWTAGASVQHATVGQGLSPSPSGSSPVKLQKGSGNARRSTDRVYGEQGADLDARLDRLQERVGHVLDAFGPYGSPDPSVAMEGNAAQQPAGPNNAQWVQQLGQLLQDPLWGTTKGGTKKRVRHWAMFVSYRLGLQRAEELGNVPVAVAMQAWPPEQEAWIGFLHYVRERVRSHPALMGAVEDVIYVARAYCARHGVAFEDPRRKHAYVHSKCIAALRRDKEFESAAVAPITMEEAMSGTNFVDKRTLQGVLAGLAWAMGCCTGRRPRTLAEMRVSDVVLRATALPSGRVVPSATFRYRDEKFMDQIQGVRTTSESYECMSEAEYEKWMLKGAAFWVYRSFVMRGLFTHVDPLLTSRDGDVLEVRKECLGWFLFPMFARGSSEVWVDTVPVGPSIISGWNRRILRDMQKPERGFAAHRKGLVTRALVCNLLRNGGRKIDEALELAVVRLGGWDVLKGRDTVRNHYVSKIIDAYVDVFSIAYDREVGQAEMERRLQRFKGRELHPPQGTYVASGNADPSAALLLRVVALSSDEYTVLRRSMNDMCERLLVAACADPSIMPIRRYLPTHDAFLVGVQQGVHAELCARLNSMNGCLHACFKRCLGLARRYALDQCTERGLVALPQHWRSATDPELAAMCAHAFDFVHDVAIGGISPSGHLCTCTVCLTGGGFFWHSDLQK